MLYHIETEERMAGGQRRTVYTLRYGHGESQIQVWPGNGFNCLHWLMQTESGLYDLFYSSRDWDHHPVPTRSGNPILFPFPNRIRGGQYEFGNRSYQLPLNDAVGQNAIHGFAPRHPWQVYGYNADERDAWIHADFQPSRDATEVLPLWTGDYLLSVIYRLGRQSLRIETTVKNLGNNPLPFGLGFHPYFRFPCADEHIDRCKLIMPARSLWETIENLPTGKTLSVPDNVNFNRARTIRDTRLDTLYTDLGCIREETATGLLLRAELGHEDLPGTLQVWTTKDFREMVLFTPPHRHAICIEPYTCATDAINLQKHGVDAGWQELQPGAEWSGIVEYRWDPTATL